MEHFDQFLPASRSAGRRSGQETFAGMHRTGRDAPEAGLKAGRSKRFDRKKRSARIKSAAPLTAGEAPGCRSVTCLLADRTIAQNRGQYDRSRRAIATGCGNL